MEVVYYRHNRGLAPLVIKRQTFAVCELTLVEKGELLYRIDGAPFRVAAGDAVFVMPGSTRERPAGEAADYVSFNFQTAHLPELPTLLPGVLGETERALIAAADIIAARRDSGGDRQMRYLISCLLAGMEARFEREREHPLMRRIKQYIESRLDGRITLADIGEETFFSPVYCETVFKKETGMPIMRYVIARRMAEAEKLLLEGTLSLRQVAESVGYTDYNYFARTFKKVTGHTPRTAKTSLL